MASIEDQIAEAKKLVEKYNINVVDVISESKSAKEPGRVGFNSMLQRIHLIQKYVKLLMKSYCEERKKKILDMKKNRKRKLIKRNN